MNTNSDFLPPLNILLASTNIKLVQKKKTNMSVTTIHTQKKKSLIWGKTKSIMYEYHTWPIHLKEALKRRFHIQTWQILFKISSAGWEVEQYTWEGKSYLELYLKYHFPTLSKQGLVYVMAEPLFSSCCALTEQITKSHYYSSRNCSEYHLSPISKAIYPKQKDEQSIQCPSHPPPSPGCLRTLMQVQALAKWQDWLTSSANAKTALQTGWTFSLEIKDSLLSYTVPKVFLF